MSRVGSPPTQAHTEEELRFRREETPHTYYLPVDVPGDPGWIVSMPHAEIGGGAQISASDFEEATLSLARLAIS